jgi:hypothetical protein
LRLEMKSQTLAAFPVLNSTWDQAPGRANGHGVRMAVVPKWPKRILFWNAVHHLVTQIKSK